MILPKDEFNKIFSNCGLDISDEQYGKFLLYSQMLVEWNGRVNLTAITDPMGITVKHFLDSLLVIKYAGGNAVPQNAALIDVGTGAGFPGIPLKIYRSDINITLLDSRDKRVAFLQAVSEILEIDAKCIHARAEDGGRDSELREKYDLVTARAVAALPVLCEYCLPFVKTGGAFIAMKGPNEEYESAKTAVSALGGEISAVNKYNLPDGGSRTLIIISKTSPTPGAYPRNAGKISKKPL